MKTADIVFTIVAVGAVLAAIALLTGCGHIDGGFGNLG